MNKQVVLICKSGPAFESVRLDAKAREDELKAGLSLDRIGVPRRVEGELLSLAERVNWLLEQRDTHTISSVAISDSTYINAR